MPWRKLPPSHIEDTREVRLLSKEMIAENTVELTFERPKDLQYAAGQYAVVKLSTPAYTALDLPWRPLSMVSHPDEEVLRFAMRLSDSSYKKSVAAMQVGDRATIFAPMGDFTIKSEGRKIAFLVSGIGVTPVLSMLKELEKRGYTEEVVVIYSNKTIGKAAYHKALQTVLLERYRYIPVFTAEHSRIDAAFLKEQLDALDRYDYYAVGARVFTGAMQELLLTEGVKREAVHSDAF